MVYQCVCVELDSSTGDIMTSQRVQSDTDPSYWTSAVMLSAADRCSEGIPVGVKYPAAFKRQIAKVTEKNDGDFNLLQL